METAQMESSYDLIVIGAGSAGLAAAQYGSRANLRVLALEQTAPGGQALLIDVLENYPGIAKGKTGFDFCEDMKRQALDFGAEILNAGASSIEKEGEYFRVTLEDGRKLSSSALILATGAKQRKLGIPGEETFYGRGVSYCATCDGPFFRGKKIFVVGGGDAACDEAQYLSRLSSNIIVIHRRERFRAQKALAGRVISNPNIEVRFNTIMKEIKGPEDAAAAAQKVERVVLEKTARDGGGTGETWEEEAGAVFIFAGTIPQTSLVSGEGTIKAQTDGNGYIITDQKMASSVPGLFAAGDLRSGAFRQVVVAAGEGAAAAHSAAAYIDELRGEAY